MKKIKEIFIITLVIFVVGITSTFAATGKSTTNGLRLRAEPSKDGEVLANINNGEKVEIIEKNGDWYKVKYDGYEGYVHSDYIKAEEGVTSTTPKPEENKPEENKPEENKPEVIYPIDVETKSGVKAYIIPSVTSSVIMTIEAGQKITINSRLNKWSYITYGNKSGWVRNYLLENTITSDKPAEDDNEQPDAEVSGNDNTPSITKGYVNVSAGIMRAGPSGTADVIRELSLNTEVTIIAEEDDWYKIEYNGDTGYMAKRLISDKQVATSRSTSESRQEGVTIERKTGYVNVGIANIRGSVSTSAAIVTTLRLKAKVDIIGEELDFYKIEINGDIGYIAKRLVSNSLEEIETAEAKAVITYSSEGTEAGQNVVEYAKQYLGYKYVSGGTTPSGFDCSGFVYYIFNSCGYPLSRLCSVQATSGSSISKANLEPGDLVFFNNNSDGSIGHVGIYIGGGNFIHAANTNRGVVIDTINSGYYYTYYYSARRVI